MIGAGADLLPVTPLVADLGAELGGGGLIQLGMQAQSAGIARHHHHAAGQGVLVVGGVNHHPLQAAGERRGRAGIKFHLGKRVGFCHLLLAGRGADQAGMGAAEIIDLGGAVAE